MNPYRLQNAAEDLGKRVAKSKQRPRLTYHRGVVSTISNDGKVSVYLDGDNTQPTPHFPMLRGSTIAVGDTVELLALGEGAFLVLGAIADNIAQIT